MRFGLVEELVMNSIAMYGLRGWFRGKIDAVSSLGSIPNCTNIDDMQSFLTIGRGVLPRARGTLTGVVVVGGLCCFLH